MVLYLVGIFEPGNPEVKDYVRSGRGGDITCFERLNSAERCLSQKKKMYSGRELRIVMATRFENY
jgi:hypothetical protein